MRTVTRLRFSGRKLRRLREEKELSPSQVAARIAEATGISCEAQTIMRWERGENQPRANHLYALAFVLGVEVGAFAA